MGVGTGVSGAAEDSWLLEKGYFDGQVQSKPDVTIKISGTTEDIHVDHFVTAKFENDKGQNFVWRFDSEMTMSNVFLKTIAPGGFDAGIFHPRRHTAP